MMSRNFYFYFRYIFLKALSGLGFSFSVFLFYPSESLAQFFFLFLIQEFYFSFYLTLLRARAHRSFESLDFSPILVLSISILLLVLFFGNFGIHADQSLIFYLSLITFPFYASRLVNAEQKSIEISVRMESDSAVLSSLAFFIILFLLSYFEVPEDRIAPFIFLRYFLSHVLFLIFSKLENNQNGKLNVSHKYERLNKKGYVEGIDVILLLFVLKYLYFDIKIINTDVGNAGLEIKYFLIAYDVIAALTGLYIRRLLSSRLFKNERKEMLMSNISLVYFLLAASLPTLTNLNHSIIATFVFSAIAVLFPLMIYAKRKEAVIVRFCLISTVVMVFYVNFWNWWFIMPVSILAAYFFFLNLNRSRAKCR